MFATAKLRSFALLLSTVLALDSCADSDDKSSAKSLDNFARGAGTMNKCGVYVTPKSLKKFSDKDREKVKHIAANNQASAYAALGAFLAVPKPLQTMFFAGDGRFRVVKEAKKFCSAAAMTKAEKKFIGEEAVKGLSACWNIIDDKLEVVVEDDEQILHHATVRMFGYMYTQFYAARAKRLLKVPNMDTKVKRGISRFKKQRDKIAQSLVDDLKNDPAAVKDPLYAFARKDPINYSNFAMTEAIDSYYCSPETRADFAKDFPATYAAFTQGPDALTIDLGDPLQ